MIPKGSQLSASYAFFAAWLAIAVMSLPLVGFIVVTDASFVPNNSASKIAGEMIGFAFLVIFVFGLPIGMIAALIARIYSATILRRYNLPMPTLLLIGGALGLLAIGIFALVTSFVFLPLGFFGGVLAGFLFYRFQTGRWF